MKIRFSFSHKEVVKRTHLFPLSRIFHHQSLETNFDSKNRSKPCPSFSFLRSQDDEDHISPDDIHLQTQTSDDQAEQADVVEVLYRTVNSLIVLFSHPCLLANTIARNNLTPCVLDCLNSALFIQLGTQSLRQNLTNEKVHIRSIFLLVTCLDYCTVSTNSSTLQLLPSIRKILHVWCEIPQIGDDDTSPLIVRLVRLINRLALSNKESIIRENLCAFLVPHFETLCLTATVIDDIVSLLITLASSSTGKRHLRRLGYVQQILHVTKRYTHLWHPLALLISQRDLCQSSILKRLIHLLTQRTMNICQSLATASNDTSFDSTTPSLKNQAALAAIEWMTLLRTSFLSFSVIVDELINYTKKVNLINMLIDTLLALQQDDESLPKLIDVVIDLLWTFSFSTSTNVHDTLQKRLDLCRWLRTNLNESSWSIALASQAILSILDSSGKTLSNWFSLRKKKSSLHWFSFLDRTSLNYRASSPTSHLICMLNSDETHHELCINLRDRLQLEQRYTVELVVTPTCQSLDAFIHLIDRASLCLFCAGSRMKTDNLSHFVHRYMSLQPHSIQLLAVLIERDCEVDGSWLEAVPLVDLSSIANEVQRHLDQVEDHDTRLPSRASNASSLSRTNTMSPEVLRSASRTFLDRPVPHWSADDVSEWCEATQGSFETLQPLVMRLNGSALVHLAEILSIEPASMYHSLNDELLQRTGTSVPLTEYVSLRSELQHLILQKQSQRMITSNPASPTVDSISSTRKKRWKKSRLCTILWFFPVFQFALSTNDMESIDVFCQI